MFKYLNNNPSKNRVGDCVIRAISTVLGKSWEETYIELCLQGYLMSDLPSSNDVWGKYLKGKGFQREFITEDQYYISDFAKEHPLGKYIVGTGTHAVAVCDGDICDVWDSSDEKPIYFYYKGEATE